MSPNALLAIAIVLELIGTATLKASDGFTRAVPTAVMIVSYGLTFWLLSLIVRQLPIGVVYAIWSGVGIAGTAAIGVLFFGETLSAKDYLGIGLIIAGALVLTLLSGRAMHS